METKRTIVIGDPHGCLEEFQNLLGKVGWRKSIDRLVVAGDLVDRGPDSIGLIRFVKLNNIECVMGNHEHKYVRFYKHELKSSKSGYVNPMKFNHEKLELYRKMSNEDLEFLAQLPTKIKIGNNLWVIHGGLDCTKVFSDQVDDKLIYTRYVKANGEAISGDSYNKEQSAKHWTDVWQGPESIVYGHFVHSLGYPRIVQPRPGVRMWGIDTGCCFGGKLTAISFPDETIYQVNALKEYKVWRNDNE